MLWPIALVAILACAQGRAVNISNTWVLPEEGFSVFYRYFRDRISWYEADAVCQFHHANLVTVDTTAQYDAVRAYLKELDISNAVWVGLIRSNPDGDFTWTDYRGLSGDGYWSAAPDSRAAPLCAAADPTADYRWEARACGGPTVASFICELPVPQWALGAEGCMVRALPDLTVLYLPESAAVQLTTDCGLDGVKRVLCIGNVKHEELLKNLSCADEAEESFTSTAINISASSPAWVTTTETLFSEEENVRNLVTTEHSIITTVDDNKKESILNIPIEGNTNLNSSQTKDTVNLNTKIVNDLKPKYNSVLNIIGLGKDPKYEIIHNDNLLENDVPKIVNNNDLPMSDNIDELEDEQHMQHKILHDELARRGNFETIFNQPSDHFVPPLVMAKAKMSDDMTVLSIEEKHAQQIAEQHNMKFKSKIVEINSHPQKLNKYNNELNKKYTANNDGHIIQETTTEALKTTTDQSVPISLVDVNKDVFNDKTSMLKLTKFGSPKKYKGKAYEPKDKSYKESENITKKISNKEGDNDFNQELKSRIVKEKLTFNANDANASDDVVSIDLKVIFKIPEMTENNLLNTTESSTINDTKPVDLNDRQNKTKENIYVNQETSADKIVNSSDTQYQQVVQITIPNDNNKTPITFEITTKIAPIDNITTPTVRKNIDMSTSAISTAGPVDISTRNDFSQTTVNFKGVATSNNYDATTNEEIGTATFSKHTFNDVSTVATPISTAISSTDKGVYLVSRTTNSSIEYSKTSTEIPSSNKELMKILNSTNSLLSSNSSLDTTSYNVSNVDLDNYSTTEINIELFNDTNIFESSTFYMPETTEDFQSPLLSGANDPLPKPNRSRRPPTPPNHNKFNPFRILG